MPEILVVEDNPPTREIYAYLLHDWGYQVRLAGSTNNAVSLVRTGCVPDAIVADYNLGGGDTGIATIRAVEGILGRPVPAVMVTGEDILPNVGLPTFRKPITGEQLRKVLNEHPTFVASLPSRLTTILWTGATQKRTTPTICQNGILMVGCRSPPLDSRIFAVTRTFSPSYESVLREGSSPAPTPPPSVP